MHPRPAVVGHLMRLCGEAIVGQFLRMVRMVSSCANGLARSSMTVRAGFDSCLATRRLNVHDDHGGRKVVGSLDVAAAVLARCSSNAGVDAGTPVSSSPATSMSTTSTTSTVVAAAEPPTATQSSSAASTTVTNDSIPGDNAMVADRGCLADAGEMHADVSSWYPASAGGPLVLNGERGSSAEVERFGVAAHTALDDVAPGFTLTGDFEYRRPAGGCVTHVYAVLTDGDEEILVSAWRLESAGDPYWVPNEQTFATVDGSTLVSSGDHIVVVLAVAPDGTTARITSYGAHAAAMVAGWPTTIPASPTATKPGQTTLTAAELIPAANTMLAYVLDQR